MVSAGNTTISAVFEGNDTYEAQTVTYTLTVNAESEPEPELPEIGTVYDFTGYLTEDAEEPSSIGQITYEGEYSENTDYVYGTAELASPADQSQTQEVTVYMTKEGLFTTLDGGRAPVYVLNNSEFVLYGYGELTEQVNP